jgi:hypothetical protein
MKRITLIIIVCFLTETAFAQIIYYKSDKYTLEINYNENSFSFYREAQTSRNVYLGHAEESVIYLFAEGNISIEKDMLLCTDTLESKNKFKFNCLTQFSLKVTESNNELLQIEDTIYASTCRFSDIVISNIKYKDGLPDGNWLINGASICNKLMIFFSKGNIVKIDNISPNE